ncbi:MAG TPA: ATP-binding protein [Polyangiales bacterium]|nr:ATP-binding protein [Polyangiales bacterium]
MALDYRAYPILYVDDEQQNLVAFRYAMEGYFTVITANTGEEALRTLADKEIAVLLADQRMPGLTGVEVCRRSREIAPGTIRMIMTAYADLHAAIDAINQGHVSRYLVKPWRNEELIEVLRTAIDLVHLQRTVQSMEMRLLRGGQAAAATTIYEELVHELSNPLGALEINASLVSDLLSSAIQGPDMPAAMRDSLSTALEAHADSLAAIAQLKGLVARVRQGTRPSLPKRASQCDAGRVVDATVRIVRTEIEKAARLGVVLESSPNVAIDASVLGQVVLNLLLNAAQAVRPETRGENLISVRVGSSQGTGEITVSDNGPGIPGENLERIFDPFFTTKETGTGLGLAICRELLSQGGGTIAVQSSPGTGAMFVIRVPLASPS